MILMSFLKKNPIFCIIAALGLAAFAAGLYLAINASGEAKQAERSSNNAQAQLRTLLNEAPALTEENLDAANRNLAALQSRFERIRQDLERGASLDVSDDGVSVSAGIQQYIAKFQDAVENHVDEAGQSAPIETPDDFAFGFEQYLGEADVPEDLERVSRLDKQRQILSYLMRQLIEANPQSIDAVEREIMDSEEESGKAFSIDPRISAQVPGAIDTIAFRLTFTGYTESLRDFLNHLADFDLPIVVRRVEVERPSGTETRVASPRRNDPNDLFGDIFAGDETAGQAGNEEASEGQEPVIEENFSEFTVILEFIELILPDT